MEFAASQIRDRSRTQGDEVASLFPVDEEDGFAVLQWAGAHPRGYAVTPRGFTWVLTQSTMVSKDVPGVKISCTPHCLSTGMSS